VPFYIAARALSCRPNGAHSPHGRLQPQPFGPLCRARRAAPAGDPDGLFEPFDFGTKVCDFALQPTRRAPPLGLPQPCRYSTEDDPGDEEGDDQDE